MLVSMLVVFGAWCYGLSVSECFMMSDSWFTCSISMYIYNYIYIYV